ncbi:MAG: N-acetylneuraminate synthase [Betaproteobacteria bacterium]|nr:N-acetylneuraminate synthase [Betaproteobacteria bacterium]
MSAANTLGTYVIAEAGVNHNGSLDTALRLVDVACAAGADAVKFQSFHATKLASPSAPKAAYQIGTAGIAESQLDMLRRLELSEVDQRKLSEHCQSRGIEFLSSAFDVDSLEFLVRDLGMRCIKVPSGEITNAPLLLRAAKLNKPVILSTGMSTVADIGSALGVLAFGYAAESRSPSIAAFEEAYRNPATRAALGANVTLLHCTTEYPAPFHEVNLRAMETMRELFSLPVGCSDHTTGIAVPIAAVALGACVIEKHFTLDRNLPGPDHQASLEPKELEAMISAIREIEAALGSANKQPTASEMKNLPIARCSLVAARDIEAGEKFSEDNLTIKRPGTGISPLHYWEWLGKVASRRFSRDDTIAP